MQFHPYPVLPLSLVLDTTTTVQQQHPCKEMALVAAYVIATTLVIVLPVYFHWAHLAWTAFFGSLGAYLRYQLSTALNGKSKVGGRRRKRWCHQPTLLLQGRRSMMSIKGVSTLSYR